MMSALLQTTASRPPPQMYRQQLWQHRSKNKVKMNSQGGVILRQAGCCVWQFQYHAGLHASRDGAHHILQLLQTVLWTSPNINVNNTETCFVSTFHPCFSTVGALSIIELICVCQDGFQHSYYKCIKDHQLWPKEPSLNSTWLEWRAEKVK